MSKRNGVLSNMASEVEEADPTAIRTSGDIMRSPMSDDLRFAVLIGLVEVGQMEDKEIVNSILHLVSCSDVRARLLPVKRVMWRRRSLSGSSVSGFNGVVRSHTLLMVCRN